MKRHNYILFLFVALNMLWLKQVYAQDETPFADQNVDDLEDVSDAFSELFFEALKQKGIENHERAIVALDACIKMEPKRPILYFEKGKNETALKQYDNAADSFNKSLELKQDQPDVLDALFRTYGFAREYDKAITVGQKLVQLDSQYKENLASLYIAKRSFNTALDLLDELDLEKGVDISRNALRERAYRLSGNDDLKINRLEKKVNLGMARPSDFATLIYAYVGLNKANKARTNATLLEKVEPAHIAVQIGSYKDDFAKKEYRKAVTKMQIGLQNELPVAAKKVIIEDFINLIKEDDSYKNTFENSVASIQKSGAEASLYRLISEYYSTASQDGEGLAYLEKALDADKENLDLIKKVTKAQLDNKQYDKALRISSEALELFPSQPQLYLDNGLALSGLTNYDEAIESLELGLDYIIDDDTLEARFYEALGNAYKGKGDLSNHSKYIERARAIKPQG